MMANDKLWSDLTTDEDRLEWIRYGRAVQTGIMAPSVADDVADMLARMIQQQAEIALLREKLADATKAGTPYSREQDSINGLVISNQQQQDIIDDRNKAIAELQVVIERLREYRDHHEFSVQQLSEMLGVRLQVIGDVKTEIERLREENAILMNCKHHNVQACHICPDTECGDNMNEGGGE